MILSWLIPPEGPRTPTTVSTRTSSPSSTGRRLPVGRVRPRPASARRPSPRRSAVRSLAEQGSSGTSPAAGGAHRSRHVRSSWGAAAATGSVIVAAGLLDPSGLAAPVAWTGAKMAREPWTWLQYAMLAPLIVALVWWWSRRLLASRDPRSAPALGVRSRLAGGDPGDDGGQARVLRGAHGACAARGVRGRSPAGSVSGLPDLGHGVHWHQGRRLRMGAGTRGGPAVEPGHRAPGRRRHAGRGPVARDAPGRPDRPRPGPGRRLAGALLVDRIARRVRPHLRLAAAGADGGLGAGRGDRCDPAGGALPRVERPAHSCSGSTFRGRRRRGSWPGRSGPWSQGCASR